MTSATFTRRIIEANRVTIPSEVMTLLQLEQGEFVHVTVEKIKEPDRSGL